MRTEGITSMSFAELKKLVNQKWPEISYSGKERDDLIFSTGIEAFDSLFSHNGIPYGQLVEINGSVSSGKTSFLFKILSSFARKQPIAYLDFSSSFFPSAAESSGIDISKIFVVRADDFREGLRAAELILRNKIVCCVVFDLVGMKGSLPLTMMHRLRQIILKAGSILIFLTEENPGLIPASMISLRLEVSRNENSRLEVAVTKSRIGNVGSRVELVQ
jgi:hypothetical protein